jgi:hypothetical protein
MLNGAHVWIESGAFPAGHDPHPVQENAQTGAHI